MIPTKGQWVRWLNESFGREGQILEAKYPSLVIKWLGVEEPQVFPWGFMYFERGREMEIIPAPKKLPKDDQQAGGDMMSVRDAAATLETTPKAIRMRLRSGKLKGLKKDGRWVGVYI